MRAGLSEGKRVKKGKVDKRVNPLQTEDGNVKLVPLHLS